MPKKQVAAIFVLLMVALLLVGTLAGCSSAGIASGSAYPMALLSALPDEVRSAPPVVQEAYQFAVANPETLQQLPCYCGCGDMGHTSNYACYIQDQGENRAPIFENHALGCSICVDITQDAMRLIREGKTLPEIRAYVDNTYAQYGPSNIPSD